MPRTRTVRGRATIALACFSTALAACRAPDTEAAERPAPDGVFAHLAGCERVELFALYPHLEGPPEEDRASLAFADDEGFQVPPFERAYLAAEARGETPPRFHGFPVLGRARLSGAVRCDELIALVEDGVKEDERRERESGILSTMLCFIPRHGISVVHDGRRHDFVLCYQCAKLQVLVDGELVMYRDIATDHRDAVTSIYESCGLTIHSEEE